MQYFVKRYLKCRINGAFNGKININSQMFHFAENTFLEK